MVLPWARTDEFVGSKHIHATDAALSLRLEMSLEGQAKLEGYRKALKTFFVVLPKDSDGRLEHRTARYALHRFFVQRHSWSIKGLEPSREIWHNKNTSETAVGHDWVPTYLLSLISDKLGHKGLELEDLAALGAAIEDLTRKEAEGTLGEVWQAMG